MSLTAALSTLSPETLAELQRVVARLGDQDNDYTADPVFEVRDKVLRYSYSMDAEDAEVVVWIPLGGDGPETDPNTLATLEAHYEEHDEAPEDWFRVGGWWERLHVASFLTREGAERFKEKRGHNYSDLYISTESAYRNPETQALLALLVALTPVIEGAASETKAGAAWTTQAAVVSDADLEKQLRADPALCLRLTAATARANQAPATQAQGGPFYLACFKGPRTGYQTWWMPNNAGYTNDLQQAGVYEVLTPGYHDSSETVPVPVAAVEQLGLRVRRMVDTGDHANGALKSAPSLREALASLSTNPKDTP